MEHRVADPGPLGLAAFAMTTFAFSSANANLWHGAGVTPALSLAFFYGGIAQLLAGMWEFVRKNTFGALAFTSYGAFWLAFYAYVNWQRGAGGLGVFLLGWTIFTIYMTIVAAKTTNAILAVFVLLSLTFIFLTIGNWTSPDEHLQLVKIGGWLGLGTAGAAWYASLAGVYNATAEKVVFPVGPRG